MLELLASMMLFNYTTAVEQGEISSISYVKAEENRPITFVFNGGPGSSSVWLHMGAFGPRRIASTEEGQSITPPYQIVDNKESLLDLTDLVFIDPSGTGLSKLSDEKKHYSINGDIHSIGQFIRNYLTKNNRWNSPKYLAGESYGGMRAAGLADYLQSEFGIYLNGVIFISPALDFQTICFNRDNPLPYFLFLPSYAATAWYHGKSQADATLEQVVASARDFAYQTYASFLLCAKSFESEKIYTRLAEITGLPLSLIRQSQGRLTDDLFFSYLFEQQNQVVGRFDSRITGFSAHEYQDPSYSRSMGIFAGAFHEYLHSELQTPVSYTLLSYEVNSQWDFQDSNRWGYLNLMSGLRQALLTNPNLKIFVGCGYFDLATPFATAEYSFDHLDIPNISIQMEHYEGGHMFYLNPSARIKFKQDLVRFYQGNP